MNDSVKRLEASVDIITEGMTFVVDDFVLGISEAGRIFVNGYTNYENIDSLPKHKITEMFKDMKDEFLTVMNSSQKFTEFAKTKGIDYYLVLDTGKAGINICGEVEGVFKIFI